MIEHRSITLLTTKYTNPIFVAEKEDYSKHDFRWNNSTQKLQVFNGSYWETIDASFQTELSSEDSEVIAWAKAKMQEEKKLTNLANQYPVVRDLKERLDLILAIIGNDVNEECE